MATRGMEPTPASVGVRRRLKLLLLLVTVFLSWAAYTLFTQHSQSEGRHRELEAVQAKLAAAQQKNEALKQEVARLNDREYIEQLARKQGMGRPGEKRIEIEKPNP